MKDTYKSPTDGHKQFRLEILALLNKHAGHLDALDMLAVASHVVGQIIALQDQRVVTSEIAMSVVSKNIAQGNHEAIMSMETTKGSA